MNLINLRVFKRDNDSIILLWDRDKLSYDDKNLAIFIEKNDDFYLAEYIIKLSKDNEKVMLGIEYATNSLSPQDKCRVVVGTDKENQFEELASIDVYPVGVLPETEKDDKEKNFHLMLWDSNQRKWRKAEGIEVNGKFVLAVKQIKE